MGMSYQPPKGSSAEKVIEHLKANPDAAPLMRTDVAQLCDIAESNVSTVLRAAVAAGILHAERAGRSFEYSLAEEAADSDEPFMAALDTQGELFLRGVEILPDAKGVLLSKEKADALIAYLTAWRPAHAS